MENLYRVLAQDLPHTLEAIRRHHNQAPAAAERVAIPEQRQPGRQFSGQGLGDRGDCGGSLPPLNTLKIEQWLAVALDQFTEWPHVALDFQTWEPSQQHIGADRYRIDIVAEVQGENATNRQHAAFLLECAIIELLTQTNETQFVATKPEAELLAFEVLGKPSEQVTFAQNIRQDRFSFAFTIQE